MGSKNIFVSTSYYNKIKLYDIINILKNTNVGIELSGGMYEKNFLRILKKFKKLKFIFHNYFPKPKKDFVINLASSNKAIYYKSYKHIKGLVRLSNLFKNKYCSFHAGFRIDPKNNELGKQMQNQKKIDREKSFYLFKKRVLRLASFAKKYKINLLIENNVITIKNLNNFKEDPFLFTHPKEIISFFLDMPKNVGLLMDVGHLKISSKTLKFNKYIALEKLKPYIKGYHLNDNRGINDENLNFTERSWFWKLLKKNLEYYSIEVKKINILSLKKQIKILKNKLN
jgi:sugar phosphate isomerase/epimerase